MAPPDHRNISSIHRPVNLHEPLPPGWIEVPTPEGRIMYVNTQDQTSTYIRPAASATHARMPDPYSDQLCSGHHPEHPPYHQVPAASSMQPPITQMPSAPPDSPGHMSGYSEQISQPAVPLQSPANPVSSYGPGNYQHSHPSHPPLSAYSRPEAEGHGAPRPPATHAYPSASHPEQPMHSAPHQPVGHNQHSSRPSQSLHYLPRPDGYPAHIPSGIHSNASGSSQLAHSAVHQPHGTLSPAQQTMPTSYQSSDYHGPHPVSSSAGDMPHLAHSFAQLARPSEQTTSVPHTSAGYGVSTNNIHQPRPHSTFSHQHHSENPYVPTYSSVGSNQHDYGSQLQGSHFPENFPAPPSKSSSLHSQSQPLKPASSKLPHGFSYSEMHGPYPTPAGSASAAAAASEPSARPSYNVPFHSHALGPISSSPHVSGTAVTLQLSAHNLKSRDLVGKSDAKCRVEHLDGRSGTLLGETEVIRNNDNPTWTKDIAVMYRFEYHQELRFTVIDDDNNNRRSDVIGFADFSLGHIVSRNTVTLPLSKTLPHPNGTVADQGLGSLTVRVNIGSQKSNLARVEFKLTARNLDRLDYFGKSDPYVKISMKDSKNETIHLLTTDFLKQTLNPDWGQVGFSIDTGGSSYSQVSLQFTVYDHDDYSKDDYIGEMNCTLAMLHERTSYSVVNKFKKARKTNYKDSGTLHVENLNVRAEQGFGESSPENSRVQYLLGGCRMRLICAVDFTQSNGDPRTPSSLHYSDAHRNSLYADALHCVANVLIPYLPPGGGIEAYGFGAVPPSSDTTSFGFPLNLQYPNDARVGDITALMAAYKDAVNKVHFSGPTNLAPVIELATKSSSFPNLPTQADQHYTLLLILTDGLCSDMPQTIERIIDAAECCPVSIVIVGIGESDFSKMKQLDSDNIRLQSMHGNRVAKRDIVQFVHWKQGMHASVLAAEVLQEIPNAFVEYFRIAGIKPNAPYASYPIA